MAHEAIEQDLRKHAIYSVLKVGDRIPMIIAITLKSPDYLFKNKPKRIKQVPFLSKDNSVLWLNNWTKIQLLTDRLFSLSDELIFSIDSKLKGHKQYDFFEY